MDNETRGSLSHLQLVGAPPSRNPSVLFVGSQESLCDHAMEYIQKLLCPNGACNICTTCHAIRNKQHYSLQWFIPEKTYTREELAPLFHTLSFALDTNELFFIVIEKADYLTTACANSLLKTLEEPPAGYHFILLTDRLDQILPTIRSRCTTQFVSSQHISSSTDSLFSFFSSTAFVDPSLFLKALDKEKPTEQRVTTLLNHLLTHWITRSQEHILNNTPTDLDLATHIIALLSDALKRPLMPGSSKITLKNLFLHIKISDTR